MMCSGSPCDRSGSIALVLAASCTVRPVRVGPEGVGACRLINYVTARKVEPVRISEFQRTNLVQWLQMFAPTIPALMKSVTINAVVPPADPTSPISEHRLYSVLLGNGNRCYFSCDRHASQFSAATREVLNDCLFAGNLVLAEVYRDWRMAWLYFDPNSKPGHEAGRCIKEAEAAFDRAMKPRGGADNIHYAWKDLTAGLGHLRQCLLVLIALYRNKGHGVDRKRLERVLAQLIPHIDQLATWGSTIADAPNAVAIRRGSRHDVECAGVGH